MDTVTTNTEYTWDISLLDKEIIQHQNFLFYISVGIIPLFKLFLLLILWKSDGSCIHMYFVCISNNTLKISQGFSFHTYLNNTKGKKVSNQKKVRVVIWKLGWHSCWNECFKFLLSSLAYAVSAKWLVWLLKKPPSFWEERKVPWANFVNTVVGG